MAKRYVIRYLSDGSGGGWRTTNVMNAEEIISWVKHHKLLDSYGVFEEVDIFKRA